MNRNIILALCVMLMSIGANAQKVGFINSQEIMESMPEVKQANSDLDVMKNMFIKKGEEMIKELQTKYHNYQQKNASGELAPVESDKMAKVLKEEESKVMEFDKTSQQKIYEKTEELLKPIHDRVTKAIDEVASENGYLYIFEAAQGIILYADPATDVTSLVKAKLAIK